MTRKPLDAERSASARGESEAQVLDRNVNELLQEVRVAQTGVQVLFAFLLSLPFTQRFADLDAFGRDVYVVTLLSVALATLCLTAPVPFHRMVFRRGKKRAFVSFADRAVSIGLVWLLVGICSAVLLVMDVVLGRTPGVVAAGVLGALGVVSWWLVPLRHRLSRD